MYRVGFIINTNHSFSSRALNYFVSRERAKEAQRVVDTVCGDHIGRSFNLSDIMSYLIFRSLDLNK